jgi:hypothetical protein
MVTTVSIPITGSPSAAVASVLNQTEMAVYQRTRVRTYALAEGHGGLDWMGPAQIPSQIPGFPL